jgi:LmbE family N-acetylglucosaminyl deacetylase
MKSRKTVSFIFLFLCVLASQGFTTHAQIRPIYDQGALGLAQQLKRLNTTASVLMIGAHPDDEDTALLAYLARGQNARTAYLSLTRGDGGQNLIGPELGEALGVIRTEELLQARRLDGAEQFFTRAYDFGFSKTLAEAKEKWDEKVILCDVVRVIRAYQPLVVISVFTGTAVDGHGQHQYAGYISPIAVKTAADRTQCVDAGPPWTVKKFYVRHRGTGEPTLKVNTGKYDPLLGRSYFEIAMQARSQHRSQEQGVLELKGDQFSNLNLEGGGTTESGIFAGIDTSVADVGRLVGNSETRFADAAKRLNEMIIAASLAYKEGDQSQTLSRLVAGYKLAYDAEWITRDPRSKAVMKTKQRQFLDAIKLSAGIQIEALADKETVVRGEEFGTTTRVFFPLPDGLKVKGVEIKHPIGWTAAAIAPSAEPQSQFIRRESAKYSASFKIRVSSDETPTQPYWLTEPRNGDLFGWTKDENRTFPFQKPVIWAEVKVEIQGVEMTFSQPIEYRYADDVRGEIRREVNVIPKIGVAFDESLEILSEGTGDNAREMSVTLTNNTTGGISGSVRLELPNGWLVTPSAVDFSMRRKGENLSTRFHVQLPREISQGVFSVRAEATVGGETFSTAMQTLAYDHIQTHRLHRPAVAQMRVIDVRTSPVKVGYIRGSGDQVAAAIRQLHIDVTEIDEKTLASGNLQVFDTIVVGIRAFQIREDIVAHNERLLDFVRNGGTLIVQYQLPQTYAQQNLTPYPTQMGPRVVDENAAVKILQPAHPIFNFPNKISDEDFTGWVQERNLYNFVQMDPKYVGLLEAHDPGEPENAGGLVIADIGKGKYIYCSYSLFRQLPAGVPGAYRLLANMLSLSKAQR